VHEAVRAVAFLQSKQQVDSERRPSGHGVVRDVARPREQCVGVTWELNMAQNVAIWALMYQGELRSRTKPVMARGTVTVAMPV
jgi:hypothetical protein